MASGIGKMPLALIATISAFILLSLLDMIERSRRSEGKRRIRLTGVQQPRDFEPRLRQLLSKQATVRGSKISVRRDEVTVDVYGDRFTSAGEVLALLVDADIEFQGDIACEEI
jgi:hypothetical protein